MIDSLEFSSFAFGTQLLARLLHHRWREAQNFSLMHYRSIDPWHPPLHNLFSSSSFPCKEFSLETFFFLTLLRLSPGTFVWLKQTQLETTITKMNTTRDDYNIVCDTNLTLVLELPQWQEKTFFWRFLFCLFRILHFSVHVAIISHRRVSTLCANLIHFGSQYWHTNPK